MNGSTLGSRIGQAALAATLLVGSLALLTGCASSGAGKMAAQTSPPAASTMPNAKMASSATNSSSDPSVQACANCAGKGMAPMVKGTAVDENGVQVIKIGVVNGYYSPNDFMVKAGAPVKVVFTGKAKGCLAKPQFKALGKKADFTTSGTATIDLGTVNAGTYDFACGMGMTGGKIVAQ